MLRLVLAILDLVVTIYSWAKPGSVYPHHIRNQLHHRALGVHNRAALLALLVLLRVQAARHNPVAVHNFFSSKPVYRVFIVHIILTSMGILFRLTIIAVFVLAVFLIAETAIFSNAYGCTNSTKTNHTNSSSSVNGSSSVSAKPSAAISSSQISTVHFAKMPPGNKEYIPGMKICF